MSDHVMLLDEASFAAKVEKENEPILVDFWAEWCPPCRALSPVIEELAQEYQGKIRFGKINVDEARDVAMKFGIRSIPTLILFKDGKKINELNGNQPKDRIRTMLSTAL